MVASLPPIRGAGGHWKVAAATVEETVSVAKTAPIHRVFQADTPCHPSAAAIEYFP
jgi:hypothetical protein